jgi:hypothetical protein
MKRNFYVNGLLIPVKPRFRRFGSYRGVVLLRAWRLRFQQAERLRPVQIEFNFRPPALASRRAH